MKFSWFAPFAILSFSFLTWAQTNAVPLVNAPLVPTTAVPGGAAFTLTVNGTGFAPGAVVEWNGQIRATHFINRAQLTAQISASDIASPGTASVTVKNQTPGGGISNVAPFFISTPTSAVSFTRKDLPVTTESDRIIHADLNRDGKTDLVVGEDIAGGPVLIGSYLGNGDGTFTLAVTGAQSNFSFVDDMVVGDFNGDGKLDIVAPLTHTTGVSVLSTLLGTGNGKFQKPKLTGLGHVPNGAVAADFNRDGKLDVALADIGTGMDTTVTILLGNGDGTFQAPTDFPAGMAPYGIVTGDFNRDGKLDLAVTNGPTNTISILLGNGDGTFQSPKAFPTALPPVYLAAADLNGDGILDLVVSLNEQGKSNTISVLLGNGDGTFQKHVDYVAGLEPISIGVADMNGDGILDVIAGDYGGGSVLPGLSVLFGNGDGTFQAPIMNTTIFCCLPQITIGDFNGDGRPDVGAATEGNIFSVFTQNP